MVFIHNYDFLKQLSSWNSYRLVWNKNRNLQTLSYSNYYLQYYQQNDKNIILSIHMIIIKIMIYWICFLRISMYSIIIVAIFISSTVNTG